MTRATKSIPVSVPAPADQPPTIQVVPPAPESTALTSALRLAQLAALGFAKGTGGVAKGTGVVAKGTGAMSIYLGRQGFALARKALSRPKVVPTLALMDEKTVASVAAEQIKGRKRGRRTLVVVALGAAVAAGAAYVKHQRREVPPIAPAPPSLRDLETS